MGCKPIVDEVVAIVCTRGRRPLRCACGNDGRWLCDGPGEIAGTTCDKPLCAACRNHIGRNLDLCAECLAKRAEARP